MLFQHNWWQPSGTHGSVGSSTILSGCSGPSVVQHKSKFATEAENTFFLKVTSSSETPFNNELFNWIKVVQEHKTRMTFLLLLLWLEDLLFSLWLSNGATWCSVVQSLFYDLFNHGWNWNHIGWNQESMNSSHDRNT